MVGIILLINVLMSMKENLESKKKKKRMVIIVKLIKKKMNFDIDID